jgi:hypothetical protein
MIDRHLIFKLYIGIVVLSSIFGLAPIPETYFANKNNALNVYFAKNGLVILIYGRGGLWL